LGVVLSTSQAAERFVESRIRAACRRPSRVFANVEWTGRTRYRGRLSDAKADLMIAHPASGSVVVATQSGEIRSDVGRRWCAGQNRLDPDPFVPSSAQPGQGTST
jgi:hypothetical protein